MSSDDNQLVSDTSCLHRKKCSERIFIGPWDIKINKVKQSSQTEQLAFKHDNRRSTISTNSSMKLLRDHTFNSTTSAHPLKSTVISSKKTYGTLNPASQNQESSSSGSTSFVTADSSLQPTSIDSEEIDFDFLRSPLFALSDTTDSDSVQTIRPPLTNPPVDNTSHLHFTRSHKKKSLLWKRSGSVFVPRQIPEPSVVDLVISPEGPIKREPILCMRAVTDLQASKPLRYQASKEARYDLLTEKWRQIQLVLTSDSLSTYSSSILHWPKQKLEHRISLSPGSKRQKKLELFLLSSLDYTFCLRYEDHGHLPLLITFTFKAQSFLKCQEWYIELYNLLPAESKAPLPTWCEVYIPLLDISVNLPISSFEQPQKITMEDVKDTVMTVLEESDQAFRLTDPTYLNQPFGLCWTTQDRVEWLHWPNLQLICPQTIEHTHRLELRPIQHTPHHIQLQDRTLIEPLPVEGFLTHLDGRSRPELGYFASFDHYLIYLGPGQVSPPDPGCFKDLEGICGPYVTGISPFREGVGLEAAEIDRRMGLLRDAKGMVDLTEVSYVRRSFLTDDQESIRSGQSQAGLIRPNLKPCLEILMENGSSLKLESFTAETCDVWLSSLSKIVIYWKARLEAERDAHTSPDLFFQRSVDRKREEGLVDTRIWSYCLYEQCRDIVKSGVLYYKPDQRGSFSQKTFILTTNGWLIYFDIYNRDTIKQTCHHEKKGFIDLAGCYFYSSVDSSKKRKGSNRDNPFKKSSKIYKTGLSTDDEMAACVFSIWKPKLRRYFSPKRHRLRVYRKDELLNPDGVTWTLLAQSRREKEEWVCALNTVTEHLIRSGNNA